MTEALKYINRVGVPIVALLAFFLIDPYQKNYLAGYVLTVLIYVKRDFLLKHLDFDYFILFVFSVIYALFSLFDPEIFTQTMLFYGLFPPVFYLWGKYFTYKTQDTYSIFLLLFLVGFLYSLLPLFSVYLNLTGGEGNPLERTIPMLLSGTPMKATLMAAYFTFNMCIPALLFVRLPRYNILVKSVLSFLFILSLLCVFRLGSRTQLAICLITFGLTILFIIPNQSLGKNLRLLLSIVSLAIVLYLYVPIDLDSEYLSTLGRRLERSDNTGSAGGRTELWAKSVDNLFVKPLGWEKSEFGHSHNLWLDVARIHGLIPFFILIFFSIRSLLNAKKAIRVTKNSMYLKAIFFSFTLAANLMFFVEPITEGIFSIFLVYCFFQGVFKMHYVRNVKVGETGKQLTIISHN